jgi:hypothetical protein
MPPARSAELSIAPNVPAGKLGSGMGSSDAAQ